MSKKFTLYSCLLLCLAGSMPGAQAMHLNRYAHQAPLVECQICYADKIKEEMVTLSCGHTFCKECFSSAINLALKEKNLSKIRCPHYACYNKPLPVADIQNYFTQEQKSKLNELQTQDWFSKQSHTKYCQTPDCNFAFINESECQSNITCEQCHKTYCAQCLINHPEYMSCQAAKEKYSTADDKANQSWKNQHSKQCPNCHTNIEKNRGCDHITCTKCRHEFCWKCMEKYPCDIARCLRLEANPRPVVQAQRTPQEQREWERDFERGRQIGLQLWANIDERRRQNGLQRQSAELYQGPWDLEIGSGITPIINANENPRANIEVRIDLPRNFQGFIEFLIQSDDRIRIQVQYNNTALITAQMPWDRFNRILDQANALFR